MSNVQQTSSDSARIFFSSVPHASHIRISIAGCQGEKVIPLSVSAGALSEDVVTVPVIPFVDIGIPPLSCAEFQLFFLNTEDSLVGHETLSLGVSMQPLSVAGDSIPDAEAEEAATISTEGIVSEGQVWEDSLSGGESGSNTACNASETFPAHSVDGSHYNPSVVILPCGWAAVAYVETDNQGDSQIKLAILKTSLDKNVFYHRKQSLGRLLNDANLDAYGTGTFEIYENVVIENTDGSPTDSLYVAFLTGPLKGGSFFAVNHVERDSETPKMTLKFDIGERSPVFSGSNDADDVQYALFYSDLSTPGTTALFSLPEHRDSQNKRVPVANPSITTFYNNEMLGGEQYIFITYQAYEDNRWNVYLQQIRFSDQNEEIPQYLSPFEMSDVSLTLRGIVAEDYPYYVVRNTSSTATEFCALLDVFAYDGRQIKNCDQGAGAYPEFCGMNSESTNARVEFRINTVCNGGSPGWAVGTVLSDPSDGITPGCYSRTDRPAQGSWCIYDADCNQYSILDDPYCSDPYVSIDYEPIDLYTLQSDGADYTRVIYNMFVSGTSSNEADVMFVVDANVSMTQNIQRLIQDLPALDKLLLENGVSAQYGLTFFNKLALDSDIVDPSPVICADDVLYNGMPVSVSGGFSDKITDLQTGLNISTSFANSDRTYAAINFSLTDGRFSWRSTAQKVIVVISNRSPSGQDCLAVLGDLSTTVSNISTNDVSLIGCIDQDDLSDFQPLYDVAEFYANNAIEDLFPISFDQIASGLHSLFEQAPVLERDTDGYEPTFLHMAELLITYEGDLSDSWPENKSSFRFTDNAISSSGATRELTALPFPTAQYGIPDVQPIGKDSRWVYFDSAGVFDYYYPHVGVPSSEQSNPFLVSENAKNACVITNQRNQVFVALEDFSSGVPQIVLYGTGDFSQESRFGNYTKRFTRFVDKDDFYFLASVTTDGVNQNPKACVDLNNNVHVTWASNRDGNWEIYYAYGKNGFENTRITNSYSRNHSPSIAVTDDGIVSIVYHSNRNGHYEIYLAYRDQKRIVPLYEQGGYLASRRSSYLHSYNTVPLLVYNPGDFERYPGTLWGVKNELGNGNDNENYIFEIDTAAGWLKDEEDVSPYKLQSVAGSRDGKLYGLTTEGELIKLSDPPTSEDLEISLGDFVSSGFVPDVTESSEVVSFGTIADSADLAPDSSPYGSFSNVSIDTWGSHTHITWLSGSRIFSYLDGTVRLVTASGTSCFAVRDHVVYVDGSNNAYLHDPVAASTTNISSLVSAHVDSTVHNQYGYVTSIYLRDAIGYTDSSVVGGIITETQKQRLVFSVNSYYDNVVYNTIWSFEGPAGTIVGHYVFCYPNVGSSINCSQPSRGYNVLSGSGRVFVKEVPLQATARRYIRPNIFSFFANNTPMPIGSGTVIDAVYFCSDENNCYFSLRSSSTHYLFQSSGTNIAITPIDDMDYFACASNRIGWITNNGSGTNIKATIAIPELLTQKQLDLVSTGDTINAKTVSSINTCGRWVSSTAAAIPVTFTDTSQSLLLATVSDVHKIVDATFDSAGRLWVLQYNNVFGSISYTISQISISNASVVRTSNTISINTPTTALGCLTCTSSGEFYLIKHENGQSVLYKSGYPAISGSSATFSFSQIDTLGNVFYAITCDEDDTIFGIDEDSDLYTIGTDGTLTKIGEPDTPSPEYDAHPLGTIAGLAYQFNYASSVAGSDGYFHVFCEFYDNIALSGSPVTTVDSRSNGASFSGTGETSETTGYYETNQGIYLVTGESAYLSLDFCQLNNPLFEINKTYFTKLYLIDSNKQMRLSNIVQPYSFSIECSEQASVTAGPCSYPVYIENTTGSSQTCSRLVVNLFSDPDRRHLYQSFRLEYADETLDFSRINNDAATEVWVESGLTIPANETVAVVFYPTLYSNIVCNVTYYVSVWAIVDTVESKIQTDSFYCYCENLNPMINVNDYSPWVSSAHGATDYALTDSHKDCLLPVIQSYDNKFVVLFENKISGRVHASVFDPASLFLFYSSGSRSWFDYDFGQIGKKPSLGIDLLGRSCFAVETLDPKVRTNSIPQNTGNYRVCDVTQDIRTTTAQECPVVSLGTTEREYDTNISSDLIEKVFVKPNDVSYFTYTISGEPVPVVQKCKVTLEIHADTDVLAYRLRNEDQPGYGEWCSWNPQITDSITERTWSLSTGSGIKKVLVQAMSYSGTTDEFGLTIIADYEKIIYDIKLYKADVLLPTSNGYYVASTSLQTGGKTANTEEITVDIYANREFGEVQPFVYFDVLQQGLLDQFNIVANRTADVEGREVYRGKFTIYKQDNQLNRDGLSRIRVRFPESCEFQNLAGSEGYSRDIYNVISQDASSIQDDTLADYRQQPTGKIGVDIVLRPTGQPYFAFGDPDLYFTNNVVPQTGIVDEKKE